ncbi:Eef1A Lysine And N-Terminal Methyltransferase [Manis pentadactyla]|nr:Eef1A Lysine And N-Terminal Methyltransferase [Manis pentadactyla]
MPCRGGLAVMAARGKGKANILNSMEKAVWVLECCLPWVRPVAVDRPRQWTCHARLTIGKEENRSPAYEGGLAIMAATGKGKDNILSSMARVMWVSGHSMALSAPHGCVSPKAVSHWPNEGKKPCPAEHLCAAAPKSCHPEWEPPLAICHDGEHPMQGSPLVQNRSPSSPVRTSCLQESQANQGPAHRV